MTDNKIKSESEKEVDLIIDDLDWEEKLLQKKPSKWQKVKESKFVTKMSGKIWPLLVPFLVVMVFLVILPLIGIIIFSIVKPTGNSVLFKISLENFINLFRNKSILMALGLSLLYAFFASLITLVIAYPMALIMAGLKNKLLAKNMWVLITMPIWINMILKILGLQSLFYILAPTALGTPIAIIIGMVYAFLPFAVSPIYNALEDLDRSYYDACLDLGASKHKAFWDITFRQSLPGVFTAFSLVIVQAATSLLIVRYMGDGKINLITSIIESYFFKGSDFGYGAAISVILAISVFILMVLIKMISNKFETRRSRRWKASLDPVTSQL